ncbi:MAG: hypothetical protein GX442_21240 [Candidatus Riflebacteria bacterium]|nr:hypothetical protein [Candidatus Riflebacteria bacterium]
MTTRLFQVPGPKRFLHQLTRNLRDGRLCILALPEGAGDGLFESLRQDLGLGGFDLALLEADQCCGSPAAWLLEKGGQEPPAEAGPAVSRLASLAVGGVVWWLEGIARQSWPVWKDFLLRFEHACRQNCPWDRPRLVIVLRGDAATIEVPNEVGLSYQPWQGILTPRDMEFYVDLVLDHQEDPSLEGALRVRLIAELAHWDARLAEYLCEFTLEELATPAAVLAEFPGAERFRQPSSLPARVGWAQGLVDLRGGRVIPHCLATLQGPGLGEIPHRLWRAQVGTLLPVIEEERLSLVTRYRNHFRVPWDTPVGPITNHLDLEIGYMDYQIRRYNLNLNSRIRRRIEVLKEARNALAHQEPVALHLLLALIGEQGPI